MGGTVETAPTGTALDTPLAATHTRAGAKMGVWFGCALPDSFGDAPAEFRQAREGVTLIDKNYRAYLSFTGPDRVRYLNAVLTNDIKGLYAGQGNVSLLLNPQGHILAESETYAFADRLFCVSYAMIRERLVEVLDKFIIMDDVTLGALSSTDSTVGTVPCRIVKRLPGGVAGAEFVVVREKLVPLWEILLEATRKHGGGPMGYSALSGLRLAQGVPWFGYDF